MKRSLPVVIAASLTVLATGGAAGVNLGLARFLALPDGAEVAVATPAAVPESGPVVAAERARPPRSKRQYIDGILARNLFDSSAIGRTSDVGTSEDADTDLDVRLVATIVADPAAYSSALIADGQGERVSSYAMGDRIKDAEIVAIARNEVTVRRGDGAIEKLRATDEERPSAPSRPAPEAGSDDEGISKEGENRYSVDRSLIDRYVNDVSAISRLGRAIPHRGPDGAIDGYRLSGIRRGTLGEKLGIRNGDVIHGVNGYDLSSMQEAMSAFQQLQSESSFKFEITRRGKRVTMEYDVR